MDPSWIEFAKVYGPLGFIALALGSFLYFKVWPIFTGRLEKAEKREEESAKRFEDQGKLFAEVIRSRDVMMAEIQERNLKALEGLAVKIGKPKLVKPKRK